MDRSGGASGGGVDARAHHEAVGRQAGAVLEEAGEVGGAHEDHRAELRQRQMLVEMLVDVLGDPPEPRQGERRRELRRRHRLHRHLPPGFSASALLTAPSRASPWNGFPRNATAPACSIRRRASSSL